MKTIFMIFALGFSSMQSSAAPTVKRGNFHDAVTAIEGIKYDNDWDGTNSRGKKCYVTHELEVDYNRNPYLSAIQISTNTSGNRWVNTRVEMDYRTPFRIERNYSRTSFVQTGARSNRDRAVVELNFSEDEAGQYAEVVLKTNLDAARVDCEISAEEN